LYEDLSSVGNGEVNTNTNAGTETGVENLVLPKSGVNTPIKGLKAVDDSIELISAAGHVGIRLTNPEVVPVTFSSTSGGRYIVDTQQENRFYAYVNVGQNAQLWLNNSTDVAQGIVVLRNTIASPVTVQVPVKTRIGASAVSLVACTIPANQEFTFKVEAFMQSGTSFNLQNQVWTWQTTAADGQLVGLGTQSCAVDEATVRNLLNLKDGAVTLTAAGANNYTLNWETAARRGTLNVASLTANDTIDLINVADVDSKAFKITGNVPVRFTYSTGGKTLNIEGIDPGTGTRTVFIDHSNGEINIYWDIAYPLASNTLYLGNHESVNGTHAAPRTALTANEERAIVGNTFLFYFNGTWSAPANWKRIGANTVTNNELAIISGMVVKVAGGVVVHYGVQKEVV
jgi:hypothetical protein